MSRAPRILAVFGTRPEVIKLAPVLREARKHPGRLVCQSCVTGQHRQMLDPLLELFDITPEYQLNIMQENQSLEYVTTTVLREVGRILDQGRVEYVLVQGDTTTAMAASLAAFYRQVKVAHVEAGLRTWDTRHPYPEEANRRIIDSVSDLYFAHTEAAKRNLLNEGVDPRKIEVTGNTVIDALLETASRDGDGHGAGLERLSLNGRKTILVTAHRRENFGRPIENICRAIKDVAVRFQRDIEFIYPVHLNPNIRTPVYAMLGGLENVRLTEPLDYRAMVQVMKRAYCVLTDSGGLQEEAPSLGKPVLVLRRTTERPEGVAAGCVEVIGTRTERIVEKITELLEDQDKYRRMSRAVNPYGDGKAGERIVKRIVKEVSPR